MRKKWFLIQMAINGQVKKKWQINDEKGKQEIRRFQCTLELKQYHAILEDGKKGTNCVVSLTMKYMGIWHLLGQPLFAKRLV